MTSSDEEDEELVFYLTFA